MLAHIWESSMERCQSEAQITSDLYQAVLSQVFPAFQWVKRGWSQTSTFNYENTLKNHTTQSFMQDHHMRVLHIIAAPRDNLSCHKFMSKQSQQWIAAILSKQIWYIFQGVRECLGGGG